MPNPWPKIDDRLTGFRWQLAALRRDSASPGGRVAAGIPGARYLSPPGTVWLRATQPGRHRPGQEPCEQGRSADLEKGCRDGLGFPPSRLGKITWTWEESKVQLGEEEELLRQGFRQLGLR